MKTMKLFLGVYLCEVRKLGRARHNVFWSLQYPCVDKHDVGELGGEAQLYLHAAFELKTPTFRKN